MLKHLVIQNYALISRLEMQPAATLNIITGETGAGKSIMLGALGLLLGNRADTRALYDDQQKCVVEGTFEVSAYALQATFDEEEIDYEDECIIRREISPKGKSRAFINDTPVTLDALRTVGSVLMDIHSQHDTLQLGSDKYQLSVIDAYAQSSALLASYSTAYQAYRKAAKALEGLQAEAKALKQEDEYNRHNHTELSKLALKPNDQEQLEAELEILENAEEIKTRLQLVLQALGPNDEVQGAPGTDELLHGAMSELSKLAAFDKLYEGMHSRVDSVLIELRDMAAELQKVDERIEHDPVKIDETKGRLSEIYRLQQKHQLSTVAELLALQEELAQKVAKVQNLDEALDAARQACQQAEQHMLAQAKKLSAARTKVFKPLTTLVKQLLADLGMPDANLSIAHETAQPGPAGTDQIALLFSANKGIQPQQLKQVASGGEFSRLMFCIKYVLANKVAMPTIIFDEIDTGISGEIAIKMVHMMRDMAQGHQVIVISHLPQIAAKGDAHYFVYKDNTSEKTMSRMRQLSQVERIEAIAKMIGGEQPSSVAYESARELMGTQ